MATTLQLQSQSWHPGETAVREMLRVPPSGGSPTATGLPGHYAARIAASPLVAFGTLDERGRPWTTVWGGERAFTRRIAAGALGVRTLVDYRFDPVLEALFAGKKSNDRGVVQFAMGSNDGVNVSNASPPMAGLSIDLETRDRVKIMGRLIGGQVEPNPEIQGIADLQMAMAVEGSLGNCPKYLNRREIRPALPKPKLLSDRLPLTKEAVDLIGRSDLFFLSSTEGRNMDTNHRGGAPGFVRVQSNSAENVTLIYPEYSGNRLYQSLGNLHLVPKVGIVFPDFDSGNALYLTGETTTLVGDKAAAYMPHAKLAVKIKVTAARFVESSLPFRGRLLDYSPYNPPVRRLATESAPASASESDHSHGVAKLVSRQYLTPTIARYVFTLTDIPNGKEMAPWKAGQYVTLDFAAELDGGYSHMREDDPQSLNDDFVRTFTVSSAPPATQQHQQLAGHKALWNGTSFEITTRRHGPVTEFLWRWNTRVPLEIPVLGFGGDNVLPEAEENGDDDGDDDDNDDDDNDDDNDVEKVFVSAGIGITPLLAQAPSLLLRHAKTPANSEGQDRLLRVLWTIRPEDVPFAIDSFKRLQGLADVTRLFVTGSPSQREEHADDLFEVRSLGAEVHLGRMGQEDVLDEGICGFSSDHDAGLDEADEDEDEEDNDDDDDDNDDGEEDEGDEDEDEKAEEEQNSKKRRRREFYVCAGPAMQKEMLELLKDEQVFCESFNY